MSSTASSVSAPSVSALPSRLPKKDLMGGAGKKSHGGGKKAPGGGKVGPKRHQGQNGTKRYNTRVKGPLHAYLRAITSPALRRVALRAGIKRISAKFFDTARNHLLHNLTQLVRSTISYTACAKRHTIYTKDVVFAANRHGQKLVGMK